MDKGIIIVINGCPGSGKTTISHLLKPLLIDCPLIDFGRIREFHLNRSWSNCSEVEELMSFENLTFILHNYLKYNYDYVLVNDLHDDKVFRLTQELESSVIVFTLIVDKDDEVRRRVLGDRDSGFKNADRAVEWNRELQVRELFSNEYRVDNSHNNPEKTVEAILEILSRGKNNK